MSTAAPLPGSRYSAALCRACGALIIRWPNGRWLHEQTEDTVCRPDEND